ncbi:hypothetical protein HMPREF1987_01614 [Peptostreptococcaceae bacterium oral taxon 113 str. W5053]|nr:hypothetical protein HMPREF1987_01614 [Peptostreptococcaceae bacterium oral taxon 113 str. W5053]
MLYYTIFTVFFSTVSRSNLAQDFCSLLYFRYSFFLYVLQRFDFFFYAFILSFLLDFEQQKTVNL